MRAEIFPSTARGMIKVPPSKSMAHRALIAAALAEGESLLSPIALSKDMEATVNGLSAMGAVFTREGEALRVRGFGKKPRNLGVLNCIESGSTLRFLIPLCLLTGETYVLEGASRLMERPLSVYEKLCGEKGFLFEKEGNTLKVRGKLSSGEYTVAGDIPSQFITGLLFALSLLSGDSFLRVTGVWESASYIDMTLDAMGAFGVKAHREGDGFFIPGGQSYLPREYGVEGDWSNAAFPLALGLFEGGVTVTGVSEASLQGDRVVQSYLKALSEGTPELDLSDCPDLAPILFAVAAVYGGARFTGTRRLAIKESDRGAAMAEELAKCGVELILEENAITVPKATLHPPTRSICGHNDHRIVMAMSVLLTRLGGVIEGAEAVTKSYPNFFEDIRKLGIDVKTI